MAPGNNGLKDSPKSSQGKKEVTQKAQMKDHNSKTAEDPKKTHEVGAILYPRHHPPRRRLMCPCR